LPIRTDPEIGVSTDGESNMRLVYALAIILFLSSRLHAFEDAGRLLQGCQALERGMRILPDKTVVLPRDSQAIMCWGYILALQELSGLLDGDSTKPITLACPPPKSTTVQLLKIVTDHARSHPNQLHERATTVVLAALRKAFPCGSQT
jgi:hypothetical protein